MGLVSSLSRHDLKVDAKSREVDGAVIWEPFFLKRRPLVWIRQTGQYHDVRIEDPQWEALRRALVHYYGEPAYEDDDLMAFRVRPPR